jgi:ABC-2 type transport system ATP-binding protein
VIVLRALGASFARAGLEIVPRFDLRAASGETVTLARANPFAASVAARMCAAIVKPTTGFVYVGDYETRLQPPQAKRLVGFVDAAGFAGDAHVFRCETAFRADVWGVDVRGAHARAEAVIEALGPAARGAEARYARAVALALSTDVEALVLDQPSPRIAERVRAFAPHLAIVQTRATLTTAAAQQNMVAGAGQSVMSGTA